MTTSSNKALLRILLIAAILVTVVIAVLSFTPDTFRYRGWPKPPHTRPLASLVGLSPQLGSAQSPARGSSSPAARAVAGVPALSAPVLSRPVALRAAGVTARASRPGAASGQGPAGRGPATQSAQPRQKSTTGNRSRGQDRHSAGTGGGAPHKSTPPTTTEARVDPQPTVPTSSNRRPSYTRSYYARRVYEGHDTHNAYDARHGEGHARQARPASRSGECEPRVAEPHTARRVDSSEGS